MVSFSIYCALVFLSIATFGSCADQYTDGNRPYKFGFNIEGEQHRQEMKDENGIIMGEFGFLTADGVYHVTVYATDENGNYKILSMKNIRVKPFPKAAVTSPAPPPRLASQPLQVPARGNAIAQAPVRGITGQSCSHCLIPLTTAAPQPQRDPQGSFGNAQRFGQSSQFRQGQSDGNRDPYNPEISNQNGGHIVFEANVDNIRTKQTFNQGIAATERPRYESNNIGSSPQQNNALFYSGSGNNREKPILISASMKIVERKADLNEKGPGESDGLPAGLNPGDMLELLYTFNYTLGFHGHHEVGYRNGFKKGYYFVTGRDGIRTKVEYEADAQGYRPKITKENLGLESQDVPKPDTEKVDKYGLKGYEFKWLYFPKEEAKI